ncbi:MAG: N-acetylmuramoyl-L-alanine amidase [Firmicutes bacterium]|nr:N-acetylmuramoyl-L-alanine amidase [Bacillota bacterium]
MPRRKGNFWFAIGDSPWNKPLRLALAAVLLLAAVLAGLWLRQYFSAGLQPQSLTACYVHGEHMRLYFRDFAPENIDLQAQDGTVYRFATDSRALNEGMTWIDMPDGLYRLSGDSLTLKAAPGYAQEGYSLTRRGCNRHWRLYGSRGDLFLFLSTVEELPEDVYDVIIDAGHGGEDSGAVNGSLRESDFNLQASLYMAELFRQAGLKVALTRDGDYSVGQEGASAGQVDPYIAGGRVDTVYNSGAKYLISNHLNASSYGNCRGYQVYSSVRCDNRWAELTAAAWRKAGMAANDDFTGLVENGAYKRYTREDPQTGSDYYYILRECGGLATSPRRMLAAGTREERELFAGAEALLLEYCFIDNDQDLAFWQEHWQALVKAAVDAALEYWQL